MTVYTLKLGGENVVFVDFDGPLLPARMHYEGFNSTIMFDPADSWQDSHETKKKIKFDPVPIHILNCLVELANVKIVISSNWSKYATREEIAEYLVGNGFKYPEEIHEDWKTTKHKMWDRSDEICHWLGNHRNEIQNYLILDDDESVVRNPRLDINRIVFVDFFDGLSWKQIFQCYEIFGIDLNNR